MAALLLPAIVLLTLMIAYGNVPGAMGYEPLRDFASNWLVKLVLFGVIASCLWHAAHRMRTALHGLGVRADRAIAFVAYGIAAVGTLLTLVYLLQI